MLEIRMKFTIQVSASAAEQFKNELTILNNNKKFSSKTLETIYFQDLSCDLKLSYCDDINQKSLLNFYDIEDFAVSSKEQMLSRSDDLFLVEWKEIVLG